MEFGREAEIAQHLCETALGSADPSGAGSSPPVQHPQRNNTTGHFLLLQQHYILPAEGFRLIQITQRDKNQKNTINGNTEDLVFIFLAL